MRFAALFTIIILTLFTGCTRYITETQPRVIETSPVLGNVGNGFYMVTEETGLYESADIGSRKVKKIFAGEVVEVVDAAGAFAQIKYSENAGWVLNSEIEDTDVNGVVRTLGEIRVKASPDQFRDNIELLESGRLATVKKRSGEWVYIKISENRGWIMAGLLESFGKTGRSSSRTTDGKVYWQVLKKSNLRSSPNVVSEILRLMPSGSTVIYMRTDGEWINVEYDGTIGYVHEDLVAPY